MNQFSTSTALNMRPPAEGAPLPEKFAALMRETRWLLVAFFALFLAITLWGYDPADPGWSHAARAPQILNPGGRIGAWLADVMLYAFGAAAWGWVLFLLFLVGRGYPRLVGLLGLFVHEGREAHAPLPLWRVVAGFALLLMAAAAIEALRFRGLALAQPYAAGGLLGVALGDWAQAWLGYLGGTLFFMALFAAGLSVGTGLSWIGLAERCGLALEELLHSAKKLWETLQDKRIGRAVAQLREAEVRESLKKNEDTEPVRIEPGEVDIPVAKKAAVRIEKERQAPLFFDAPGGALPPLHLLDEAAHNPGDLPSAEILEFTSRLIERKLADFGVEVKVVSAHPGPVVTRYEIEPATGVKGSTIVGLAKDLARALSLISLRVVETIPGKSCMALELPNPRRQMVRLSEIIGSEAYNGMHSPLAVSLGKDISGQPVCADLAKMPHLLVAGTTGSGKSVGVNAMILSLIYKSEPKQVRMIMIDPKMLELSIYEGIPHLLAPVVTDMTKAANALHWCVGEMEKRYKLLSAMGVRNLSGFNNKILEGRKNETPLTNPFTLTPENPEALEPLPYIVVIIDELADMMMVVGKKVEELIARLAQKARAAGIHLIIATQRPSVDVITGLIKANIPTRIAFQVSSKIDSRTILDQMGAEALLGQGDMLWLAPGTGLPHRVHGAFVSDDEVHRVVEHLKKIGPPEYIDDVLTPPAGEGGEMDAGGEGSADAEADPMYDQAVEVVLKTRRPSISLVQRHLRIGYNRAARMIEAMEKAGLVSPMNATGNREVLAPEGAA